MIRYLTIKEINNLYIRLGYYSEMPETHSFLDFKVSGNSDVIVKKKGDKAFVVFKDIPIFYKMVDFSLIYYRCFINFSDQNNSVDLKVEIKPYVIIIFLCFLSFILIESINNSYSYIFIGLSLFCLIVAMLIISRRRKFKEFILNYLKTIANER